MLGQLTSSWSQTKGSSHSLGVVRETQRRLTASNGGDDAEVVVPMPDHSLSQPVHEDNIRESS